MISSMDFTDFVNGFHWFRQWFSLILSMVFSKKVFVSMNNITRYDSETDCVTGSNNLLIVFIL